MPYSIKKTGSGRFKVVNKLTGTVYAKHTSKKKAEAQVRLLNSVEHRVKLPR